jgi:hypothetical protein
MKKTKPVLTKRCINLMQLLVVAASTTSLAQSSTLAGFGSGRATTQTELIRSTSAENIISFKPAQLTQQEVITPSGVGYTIKFDKSTLILEKGAPELGKLTSSVIIPDYANMEVQVVSSHYTDYPNIDIAPSKGVIYRNVDPATVPLTYGEVYSKNEFFPSVLAELRTPYILRDFRAQTVVTYPVQYNPVTKVLRVYDELTVKLSIKDYNGINVYNRPAPLTSIDAEFNDLYKSQFVNFTAASQGFAYTPVSEEGTMLIICHDAFMDAMKPFVRWKNMKGIKTEMVSVSSVGNDPAKIKTYVSDYYTRKSLKYLLLVGDGEQVKPVNPGTKSDGSNVDYSDISYACVTGTDHYAEFFVGRFSAEAVDQVQTQVARTLAYEQKPEIRGTWYKKGLTIASDQGGNGSGDNNEADYVHEGLIRTNLMKYTYTDVAQLYDGKHGDVDLAGNPTAADVAKVVNGGISIITYTGHGSQNAFSTSGFSSSDVNSKLTNTDKWPFIFSVACENGEFVGKTCFAESWLRLKDASGKPKGAIAAIMSTILQDWDSPMKGQDEMVDILTETKANNIKHTFGGITRNGCGAMIDAYSKVGQDMADTWTVFGDPSVVIRTDTPTELAVSHDKTYTPGKTSFSVTCNTKDALIAAYHRGQLLGTVLATGSAVDVPLSSALVDKDSLFITVTKYNATPYMGYALAGTSGIKTESGLAATIHIAPNPVSGEGKITYALTETTDVTVKIYNTVGQEVLNLLSNAKQAAGSYTLNFDATTLTAGVYFCKVQQGDLSGTKKLVINR